MQDKDNDIDVVEPETLPTTDELERVAYIIKTVENAKQEPILRQIEMTNADNERMYNFQMKKLDIDNARWSKTFYLGVMLVIVLLIVALYLLLVEKDINLGLGLLTNIFTGVFAYLAGKGSSITK
ncbi:hypothetical protein [Campylobacter sp. MG1]|uniref:hypothetical protein n=1 Tax=Campylobacter sp. MG1 TaxID=2976332 RepID=UPI00226CCCB3|nr:hypothetical protein [Campylobacter sp. MG1]